MIQDIGRQSVSLQWWGLDVSRYPGALSCCQEDPWADLLPSAPAPCSASRMRLPSILALTYREYAVTRVSRNLNTAGRISGLLVTVLGAIELNSIRFHGRYEDTWRYPHYEYGGRHDPLQTPWLVCNVLTRIPSGHLSWTRSDRLVPGNCSPHERAAVIDVTNKLQRPLRG